MTKLTESTRRLSHGGVEFVLERVLGEKGEVGFSLTWPSSATPVEILEQCVEPERAQAETDVVVSEIATGREVVDKPLDQVGHSAIRRLTKRGHVVQFNAPFWSIAFWPATDRCPKVIEFTGSKYQSAVSGIVDASLGLQSDRRFERLLEKSINELID